MGEPIIASDVQSFVAAGVTAQNAGDSYGARQHFRKALDLEPASVEALLGLAEASLPYRERRDYLQRVLAIDPGHTAARAALAEVETRLAAGQLLAPRAGEPPPALPQPQTMLALPALEQSVLPGAVEEPDTLLTCYNHPQRETGLRCTSCNRPICAACVRRAPVGQLCPECARARRPTNYQVPWWLVGAVGVMSAAFGFGLSFLLLRVLLPLPFISFIIGFIVAPLIGEGYARLLDRLTRAKRGRALQIAVGVGVALGLAPLSLGLLFGGAILALLLTLVVGGLVIGAVVRRLI